MPKILVLKRPNDRVHDEIDCSEEDLGDKVEELYKKLDPGYSIEVRYN